VAASKNKVGAIARKHHLVPVGKEKGRILAIKTII
jgi:hypothetical protein